jgi:anaerobic ribonucleoside-triphosphate reductase activating protein
MSQATSPTVRLSGIIRQSIVDGPGLRFVVFTQGCPHACPGCHNPHTHDFNGGYDCRIDRIITAIDENPLLRGVTLSGGEPFCRARELVPLAKAVKERGLDIFCYSGYAFEELLELAKEDEYVSDLLASIDVLVDGRYEQTQRDLSLRFRGSRNQRVIDIPTSLKTKTPVLAALPE